MITVGGPLTAFFAARVGRANVQVRIREELATDPTRSDRAIAAVIGCDHKTIAKARKTPTPASDAAAAAD